MSEITAGLPVTYSADEVAATLGVTRRWLLERAAANPRDYPSRKLGRKTVRFSAEDVEHIVAAHARAQAETPEPDSWGRKRRAS